MPPISIDKNFFGIAKSRPDAAEILSRLDPALASMWADGTIATITAAYE
jgi:ABC-type amino acid transport substrate-binding protein